MQSHHPSMYCIVCKDKMCLCIGHCFVGHVHQSIPCVQMRIDGVENSNEKMNYLLIYFPQ